MTTKQPALLPAVQGSAVFSECRTWRYELVREWEPGLPLVNIVLLNPSTADATTDDPTMRRARHFAQREGYGGMVVGNLFAYRATDPRALRTAEDPVGPDTDTWLHYAVAKAHGRVWVAWGVHGRHLERAAHVLTLLEGLELRCFGVNEDGSPRHPLYLAADTPLVPFPRAAA